MWFCFVLIIALLFFVSCGKKPNEQREYGDKLDNEVIEQEPYYNELVVDSLELKLTIVASERGLSKLKYRYYKVSVYSYKEVEFKQQADLLLSFLDDVSRDIDVAEIKSIYFPFVHSKVLFEDFAYIPEIQQEIVRNINEGKSWVSMKVMEDNYEKVFSFNYFIEELKCRGYSIRGVMFSKCMYNKKRYQGEGKFALWCGMLNIAIN